MSQEQAGPQAAPPKTTLAGRVHLAEALLNGELPATLTPLSAFHEHGDVRWSTDIGELAAALAAAQGEIKAAPKDKVNPYFSSKYADLDACWDVARGPLSKNGLAVTQWASAKGRHVTVTTLLAHKSGQWMVGSLTVLANKEDAQAAGGAITYARRYAFSAAVGITADEDDDGNAATGPQGGKSQDKGKDKEQGSSKAKAQKLDIDPATTYDGSDTLKQALCAIAQKAGIPKDKWAIPHERAKGKPFGEGQAIVNKVKEELSSVAQ